MMVMKKCTNRELPCTLPDSSDCEDYGIHDSTENEIRRKPQFLPTTGMSSTQDPSGDNALPLPDRAIPRHGKRDGFDAINTH